MAILVFDGPERADACRIVLACAGSGYVITRGDAMLAWQAYSDKVCLGWAHLPSDPTEIVERVIEHCRIVS